MRAYLCDAWETDTPFVYSGNTKSGDEMLPTVDYLDILAFNLTILRQGTVVVTMRTMTQQWTMMIKVCNDASVTDFYKRFCYSGGQNVFQILEKPCRLVGCYQPRLPVVNCYQPRLPETPTKDPSMRHVIEKD